MKPGARRSQGERFDVADEYEDDPLAFFDRVALDLTFADERRIGFVENTPRFTVFQTEGEVRRRVVGPRGY